MKIGSLILVLWLVIGLLAAFQRDYFSDARTNCAEASTIAVTIVAGPLNYVGLNPKIEDCPDAEVPEPSN